MRRALALVVVAILGAGCTGDRPATRAEQQPDAPPSDGLPRCDASIGAPPEDFLLVRSREIRYPDHFGVREEYRHEDGRLLVYLLGVMGEMGEGASVVEDVDLASGQVATLFGTGGRRGWSVSWAGEHPCPQLAVVGNGFSRAEFISALRTSGILAGSP